MAATGQNFDIYQGEVKILRMPITDDNNLPVDLANTAITWIMYRQTTKEIIVTKTLNNGIEIVGNTTDGIIDITIDPADTTDLLMCQLNHECKIVDAIGPSVVCVGIVNILDSVIN
jgi:hypothetical protein